ncbi:MAG TPA: hypothetical protein VMG12_23110 [Polyangiaceae bacterium]|nr:hypothetical protein [Polyangiaceae bacterium]
MFVVFAIGLVTVGTAIRFALRGEHQLLGFVRYSLRALLLSGLFGFATGMIKVLHYGSTLTEDYGQMARIVIQGTSEAANNPAAALMFSVLACIALAVGQRRFPQPNPSAVPR